MTKIIFVFLLFSSQLIAGVIKEEASLSLLKLINKHKLNRDSLGFELIDIETSKVIESYNAHEAFIPASVTKILTSYFALEVLGAKYRFTTELSYDGEIKDGILEGNLYLIGSGDPLLTTAHLMNLALSLKAYKIKSITGNLFFLQDSISAIKMISKIGLGDQTYNPGIANLSVNFNRFSVINIKNKKNYTLPPLDFFEINPSKLKFGPGMNFKYLNDDKSLKEKWFYDKNKNYKSRVDLPIRRPDLYTINLFHFLCKKMNISLPKPTAIKEIKEPELTHIGSHRSLDIFSIASLAMEYSNNLLAEQLMMKAALELSEKTKLSHKDAVQVMNSWLKDHPIKLNKDQIILKNSSGLTIKNQISPSYLTKLLSKIIYNQYSDRFFLTLFSLSGDSGWLKKRLNSPDSAYNVWAKTGSLDYVNNIAGIITTKKSRMYAFSIFTNDRKKREILSGKNSYKLQSLRKRSSLFRKKSTKVMDNIIRSWINKY